MSTSHTRWRLALTFTPAFPLDGSISASSNEETKGLGRDDKYDTSHHVLHASDVRHTTDMGEIEDNIRRDIASHMVNDPMLDPSLIDKAQAALELHDEKAELALEELLEDDSIYPEVRAAVSNIDDPSMPVNTWRAWFLGIISSILLAGINQYFIFSTPILTITQIVPQLLAFPIGRALEHIPYPEHWPGHRFVKPGPFNIKEHTLITVMASVSYGSAYATEIYSVQRIYYNQPTSIGYQFLIVISTQLIGFSLAGVARKFLIWPAAMIWPSTLPVSALLNTLHKVQEVRDGGWTRLRTFLTAFLGIFAWEFVPGYLFTGLSYFSWPAWAAPNNVGVNIVFGGSGGLGLNFISFDWSVVTSYLSSPLMVPLFAQINVFVGYLIIICVVAPIIFATNTNNGAYLPFVSSGTYDRFGNSYNSTHILTADKRFDDAAYETYSKQYLPSTFMVAYGFGFASVTACLTHVAFFYGRDLIRQFKRSLKEEPDIHARLMSAYKEVPHWWYAVIGLGSFAMAIPTVHSFNTGLPVWGLVLALVISIVYTVPIGIIQAITAQQIGLNVITEMIIGYMLPGRPVAMMAFKTYGYITMAQAMSFISDMKLGHYMKIPPRTMFAGQVVAQLISCIVQVGVTNFVFNIPGVCTKAASIPRFARCSYQHTFYSASVIWGLIGPAKNFGANGGCVVDRFAARRRRRASKTASRAMFFGGSFLLIQLFFPSLFSFFFLVLAELTA